MKGTLIVLSGFSGVGKGTVVQKMMERHPFTFSVSAATRPPRPDEIDGVHYHFITREEFSRRVEEGYFLEWANYTSGSYGTPKAPVLSALARGEDVLLEIEENGALQIKAAYPNAFLLYMMPPSFKELARRLTARGTETPDMVRSRLLKTLEEFPAIRKYDAVVINRDAATCAEEILRMIEGRKEQETFLCEMEAEARALLGQ